MSSQWRLLGEQQQCMGELDGKINQLTNTVSQVLLAYTTPVMPTSSLISVLASKCFLLQSLITKRSIEFQ